MKQTTQKFLARLLALLLVLGLAPEAWSGMGGIIPEAAAANNSPYLWVEDAYYGYNHKITEGGSVYLDYYNNNRTGYRTLTVGDLPASATVSWTVGGVPIISTSSTAPTKVDNAGYVTAYKSGNTLYVTVDTYYANSYYNYYNVVATVTAPSYTSSTHRCTLYTDYNNNTGSYLASVTVSGSYALGNVDDAGRSSIVSQLDSYYSTNTNRGRLAYVIFNEVDDTYGSLNAVRGRQYNYYNYNSNSYDYLPNVVFTPKTNTGVATFNITAYYYNYNSTTVNNATPVTGYISFDTRGGTISGGDINYTGVTGEDVYFSASDFYDFYYSKTNGGTLSSVRFSTPSSGTGTLYTNNGSKLSSSTDCYYSPSGSRTALDGVYFTPTGTTASRGNTVRISFTAYGNRNYYYNSNYNTVSGTVVIDYLTGTVRDITFTPAGGSVILSSSEFTTVYREVIGSSAPSNFTVQFQSVPSNGTLTYNSTRLTNSNIKSYRFTTSQLNNITYTASGTYTESIDYIAYTSGTSRYSGRVVFNPNTLANNITVALPCTSTGVAFSLSAFNQANPTVMASTTQIHFTVPRNGSLTYAGTAVSTSGVTVPVSMLNQVYYRPNTYFNSTDQVAFVCYNAAGVQIGTGQVNLIVSGNTNNTGAGSVDQFTDVPATAWYRAELADLVSKGIMQGKGNGKFDPTGKVKNGEALKMILLAAGYPAQTEPAGNDWAINYKNLAVSNNLISSSVSLNSNMTRNAVAELAAKALGLTAVTSGKSPFTDSTNGYAIALYNAGILTGDTTSGSRKFLGGDTLQRAEICAIIYRINSYRNASQAPGWLS